MEEIINDIKKNTLILEEISQSQIFIKNMLMKILDFIGELECKVKHIRIKNKGTGAGGDNTNKNGCNYEDITYLPTLLNIESNKVFFGNSNDYYYVYDKYIILKKNGLYNYLYKDYNNNCEKKLKPDECILNVSECILYILEKKFQQGSGSVDEKIQTALFKKWFYKEQYPKYTIIYIYVLSDWFKQKKYRPEMRYLHNNNIHVLFGSDHNYVNNLLNLLS